MAAKSANKKPAAKVATRPAKNTSGDKSVQREPVSLRALPVPATREQRQHTTASTDQRGAFSRDRDRLIYAASFRRLAGVTQVVGAVEAHVFHNRLTHTLKVAQIARRLAEYHAERAKKLGLGPIDPDVVEAAALAHDLGHPPFGHVAEAELNRLVRDSGDNDGFEGNAQSFRIVTRLEAHRPEYNGVNLTRATLNAILKHPKLRAKLDGPPDESEKFGAFRDDAAAFVFARSSTDGGSLCIEAEMMDMADGLAYSVHDLDDFHRAGLIPLAELAHDAFAFERFIDAWKRAKRPAPAGIDKHEAQLRTLLQLYAPTDAEKRYQDPWERLGNQQSISSYLINRFISKLTVGEPDDRGRRLTLPQEFEIELRFLQRLVWHYVIEDPRLATQQHGQRKIISTLFEMFREEAQRGHLRMMPALMHRQVSRINTADAAGTTTSAARVAADVICTFTDAQAAQLYRRVCGVSSGSVADLVVS
jgi:dGTPase